MSSANHIMVSVVQVGYTQTSYTLTEDEDSVELCVNATSPGIAEEFMINATLASL